MKNGVIFRLFWYQWHPIECLGQTNNIQTDNECLWMGFVMLLGCGGWVEPTWEHFLSESWYLTYHTLLRTTILAVNDSMLLNNGKIALTQQSTSMVETVSIGG